MSIDIRTDWIELGIRIAKGIDTLGAVTHDSERVAAKIAGLQGAQRTHTLLVNVEDERLSEIVYESAWLEFQALVRERSSDASFDANIARSEAVRTYAEGYKQGLDLALSYTGGFGH